MQRARTFLFAVLAIPSFTPAAFAGMPSPLPSDVVRVLELNESAEHRIQAISFFLVGLLISTFVVRWLWNALRRDFKKLPHLTFGKSLVLVCIWGLLFVIVLTMISGARELMTPSAWKQDGLTYTLATDRSEEAEELERLRREAAMLRLKNSLWDFADRDGSFPLSVTAAGNADIWKVPGGNGVEYLYFPNLTTDDARYLLACEPDLFQGPRFVLLSDGQVQTMTNDQVRELIQRGREQ